MTMQVRYATIYFDMQRIAIKENEVFVKGNEMDTNQMNQQQNGQQYTQQYAQQPYIQQPMQQPYAQQPYTQQPMQQPYGQQPQYIPPMPPYAVPGAEQGPRKPSVGDRIGYFFLSWLPAIACLGLQIIIGFVYAIGMGIVKMVLFMMEHPEASQSVAMDYYMEEVMKALTGGVFFYHLLSLPIFGVWYYFGCKKPKLKESVKHVSPKAVVIATIGGIVMLLMSNGLVGIETYIMPKYVESFVESMETMDIGFDILATLATVVLAPIGEEILCRGLILYYAKKAFPKFWMANILQAFLFGFIHMNLIQGIYAFAGGLIIGWLAERYKSILPCMLMHFVVNFSTTFWFDKAIAWVPDELYAYIIMFIVALASAIGLVFWSGIKREDGTLQNTV